MLVKKYSKTKPTCKVTFTLAQEAVNGAKRVNILGEFNNWNPNLAVPMKLSGKEFKAVVELPVGKDYQFRYKADNGVWENDWAADGYVEAPYNVCNSVLSLEKQKTIRQKATSTKTTTTKKKENSKTKNNTVAKKTKDNLQKVEGIGPKIAELLTKAGITTFADLSVTKKTTLVSILEAAGSRYKMHDPSTWAKQAKLAAKGKWDKLATLQSELIGGKKK